MVLLRVSLLILRVFLLIPFCELNNPKGLYQLYIEECIKKGYTLFLLVLNVMDKVIYGILQFIIRFIPSVEEEQ